MDCPVLKHVFFGHMAAKPSSLSRPRRTWQFRHRLAVADPLGTGLGRVVEVGFAPNTTLGARRARVLGRYALVYVVDGRANYADAAGRKLALAAGDVLTVFPDIAHRYAPPEGEAWSQFWICFEGAVFDCWRQAGLLDPDRPVRRARPVDRWLRRFREVAPTSSGPARTLDEVARLQGLLAALCSQRPEAAGEAGWTEKACALLESANPAAGDTVAGTAKSLGLGAEAFRKRFTRLTGVAPGGYLLSHRIDHACSLLRTGRPTNEELATRLGFCDGFHFSRRFKQVVGCSPRVFRAQLSER
jgi:AraC-like DNA-binding protein/quercetin dioxygenase-like cupin family protein